jgi:hypothetical protein
MSNMKNLDIAITETAGEDKKLEAELRTEINNHLQGKIEYEGLSYLARLVLDNFENLTSYSGS